MTIDSESPRPEPLRKQGQMVVQCKGEMVVDKVLTPSVSGYVHASDEF